MASIIQGTELGQPGQHRAMEGLRCLVMGAMPSPFNHFEAVPMMKLAALLGYVERDEPVISSPHQQQGLADASQKACRCGCMGPEGHGNAHGSQRPNCPAAAGWPGDQSMQFVISDHGVAIGRLNAQIQQG